MTNLLWVYVDKFGCGAFRCYFPAYYLEQTQNYASNFIWQEHIVSRESYVNDLKDANIVIFQRSDRAIFLDLMKDCRARGIRTVYEVDDLLFDVPRHNPAAWMWRRKPVQKLLKTMLEMSDAVIASTKPLGERIEKEMGWTEGSVHLCHNHLNDIAWGPSVLDSITKLHENNGRIVLGWQGSTTHDVDFKEALPAIKRVTDENPNVILRLFGDVPRSIRGVISNDKFEWTGGVPYEQYPVKLKYCNFDIGLAPVTPSTFNICKSNIKWLEYSAIKIPTCASRVYPYEQSIKHGETGFLAKDTNEWYENLSLLVRDAQLRKKVGEAAHAVVWEKWSSPIHAPSWDRTFKSLLVEQPASSF